MDQGSGLIPTILLTGFLGAGKTTLLNRLITHYRDRRTVVLMNEFGKRGIDGARLVQGNYEMIELNKGSLFCICVRTDFITEVEHIAGHIRPELLIIEATGLADTTEMERMLSLPNLSDTIRVSVCICIVDCQNFLKIRDVLRSPVSQVRSADLVILNKTDLVSARHVDEVREAVKAVKPTVPVVATTFGTFPLTELERLHHPESSERETPGEGRPDPMISVTLEREGMFTRQTWETFQSILGSGLYRVKGFIFLDNQSYYIDATTDRWTETPMDTIPAGMNRLVLIGQDLKEETIQGVFEKQLSKDRKEG